MVRRGSRKDYVKGLKTSLKSQLFLKSSLKSSSLFYSYLKGFLGHIEDNVFKILTRFYFSEKIKELENTHK